MIRRFAALLLATAALPVAALAASAPTAVPANATPKPGTETATFSGGCFWSMNAIFERVKGVKNVTAGFSGGTVPAPSYERVCTGTTGHAESVNIKFDPSLVSYHDLLQVFFALHDPTTLNRQGADFGTQYRSVVFFHSPEQKAEVEKTIADLTQQHAYKNPIVTQVVPYTAFFAAEDYHQAYYDKNADNGYCQAVIAPKLDKLKHLFGDRLKTGM